MSSDGTALVDLDEDGVNLTFRADVLAGLSQPQKALPARWFYDERGSELFEEITHLPEYYPTRAETEILEAYRSEIAARTGKGRAVVEFGSGSSAKTPLLLNAIDPAAYVPLDISRDFLRASAAELAIQFPELPVSPMEADFMKPVALPPQVQNLPKLGFFPGSTIGNMVPAAVVDLLRSMRETLGADAMLLIGLDLIKDAGTLVAAYDDPGGVIAAFNLNLLHRINKELDSNMPVNNFAHEARWNDPDSRIEMHLLAQEAVAFEVCGRRFALRQGETIHTENSHKYDLRSAYMLLRAGNWAPLHYWCDLEQRFAVVLAEASEPCAAP